MFGGAISLGNASELSCIYCTFANNSAGVEGSALFSSPTAALALSNTTMQLMGGEDSVAVTASRAGGLDLAGAIASCPLGHELDTNAVTTYELTVVQTPNDTLRRSVSWTASFFSLNCRQCPPNQYSLAGGRVSFRDATSGYNQTSAECRSCEYGATCSAGRIQALPGFFALPTVGPHFWLCSPRRQSGCSFRVQIESRRSGAQTVTAMEMIGPPMV